MSTDMKKDKAMGMKDYVNQKETDDEVGHITVEKLDDGSFLYKVCPKNMGQEQKHSFKSVNQVKKALADDLTSPHMKAPLGSGQRFAELKGKLAKRKGVSNPGALAAFIGRKKYGAKKFNSLAAKGKPGF